MRRSEWLFGIMGLTIFIYLAFDAIAVIRFGGLTSRIDLLVLKPHATKILLWSAATIFVLRPRFGWKFPIIFMLIYGISEIIANSIYIALFWPSILSTVAVYGIDKWAFSESSFAFLLMIAIGYIVCKDEMKVRLDWGMLPFIVFVGGWILMGYHTEICSTCTSAVTYQQEAFEFIWNVTYLLMALCIFQKRGQSISQKVEGETFGFRPSVG